MEEAIDLTDVITSDYVIATTRINKSIVIDTKVLAATASD